MGSSSSSRYVHQPQAGRALHAWQSDGVCMLGTLVKGRSVATTLRAPRCSQCVREASGSLQ